MQSKQVQMFAARHAVNPDEIFSPVNINVEVARRLQNELSHYDGGWQSYMQASHEANSKEQAYAMAQEHYQKMTNWCASAGAISRTEWVNGFVDAWKSLQPAN